MPLNIKAVGLKLSRLDGRRDECAKPYEVDLSEDQGGDTVWSLATKRIQAMARTAPMLGSYHDVDFAVTFEDGEVYTGTLHVDHDMVTEPYDLGRHIREFCESAVGQRQPARMTAEAYEAQVNKVPIARRMYYRAILDYYDLNQKANFDITGMKLPSGTLPC